MTNVYEAYERRNYLALELAIEEGKYISPKEFSTAMKYSGDKPIPSAVRLAICASLDGKNKKPRGRKPANDIEFIRRQLGAIEYKRLLPLLQQPQEKHDLEGWECFKDEDWQRAPPHERAARMVKERLFPRQHWRTVLRYISMYG